MLADDVDGAFLCLREVAQRVFSIGEAAGETDGEEGWVMIDDLGVGEGGQVCGCA